MCNCNASTKRPRAALLSYWDLSAQYVQLCYKQKTTRASSKNCFKASLGWGMPNILTQPASSVKLQRAQIKMLLLLLLLYSASNKSNRRQLFCPDRVLMSPNRTKQLSMGALVTCIVVTLVKLVLHMRVGAGQTVELSTDGLFFKQFYRYQLLETPLKRLFIIVKLVPSVVCTFLLFYRIRLSTWLRLVKLKKDKVHTLSARLRKSMDLDPVAPILTELHLRALDRRLGKALGVIRKCISENGKRKVLIKDYV